MGGIQRRLHRARFLDELCPLGQDLMFFRAVGIALAALAQKDGIVLLQRFGVVHRPADDIRGRRFAQQLRGGIAHLAVHNAPEAHASLGSAGKFLDLIPAEDIHADTVGKLEVELIVRKAKLLCSGDHRLLKCILFHRLCLLIFRPQ